jgi:hypothetical protein
MSVERVYKTSSTNVITDLLLGVGYTVYYDKDSIYRRSAREMSYVRILDGLVAGDTVTVVYHVNPDVPFVQSFMESPDNKVIGSDVLVKSGISVGVKVEADITIVPGSDFDATKAAVESLLDAYFSDMKLGDDVQKTDVINVIYDSSSVDFVDTSTFRLKRIMGDGSEVDMEQVTVNKNEYVVLVDRTIT